MNPAPIHVRYKPDEWFECKRKVAHHDWWSAYLHLRRLQRVNPYKEVAIYGCDYCNQLHVGSPISFRKIRRIVKKLRKTVTDPLFCERAPIEVQSKIATKLDILEKAIRCG